MVTTSTWLQEINVSKSEWGQNFQDDDGGTTGRGVGKGQRVIKQHTEGDCFYVIDAGDYDCRVDPDGTREDGGQVVHSYSGSGHFGELALMYSQPRAASVFCTSESGSLWKLEAAAFKTIIVPTSESLVRTLL